MNSHSFTPPASTPRPDQCGSQNARWPASCELAWTASRRPVRSEVRAGPVGLLRILPELKSDLRFCMQLVYNEYQLFSCAATQPASAIICRPRTDCRGIALAST